MTAKKFWHKVDEGKALASLKQLIATAGSRKPNCSRVRRNQTAPCLNYIALLTGAGGGLAFQSADQTSRQLSAFMVG